LKVDRLQNLVEINDIPKLGRSYSTRESKKTIVDKGRKIFIPRLLKNARYQAGLSQQEVADQLNTTATVVSRWERGVSYPDQGFLLQLCHLYKITPEEIGLNAALDLEKTDVTCYLSASPHVNVEVIQEFLLENNIRYASSSQLLLPTKSVVEGINNAISNTELFIAVLDGEHDNKVYFELGIAIAIGIRSLIIALSDTEIPLDIAEIPQIHTKFLSKDIAGFALNQMLLAPSNVPSSPQSNAQFIQKSKPIGDVADKILAELDLHKTIDDKNYQKNEIEIIRLLTLALEQSGVFVVTEPLALNKTQSRQHADLVVWSDEFDPWIGNPLIIEVKRLLTPTNSIPTLERVVKYLQLSNTRSALILYAMKSRDINHFTSQFSPYVFFLSIEELLTSMRTKSFAKVVIDLRNNLVHGANVF